MSDTRNFDVIVIGAGPGGYVAAIRAAQLGMSTAIIEKRSTLGGTCLNIGCIPSKALLDSSEFFARAKHEGAEHGVVSKNLTLDLATMQKRKDGVVEKLVSGVSSLMKKHKISVFTGTGRLGEAGRGDAGAGGNGGGAAGDDAEAAPPPRPTRSSSPLKTARRPGSRAHTSSSQAEAFRRNSPFCPLTASAS